MIPQEAIEYLVPRITAWEYHDHERLLEATVLIVDDVAVAVQSLGKCDITIEHDTLGLNGPSGLVRQVRTGPSIAHLRIFDDLAILGFDLLRSKAFARGQPITNEPEQFSTPEALRLTAERDRKAAYEQGALF